MHPRMSTHSILDCKCHSHASKTCTSDKQVWTWSSNAITDRDSTRFSSCCTVCQRVLVFKRMTPHGCWARSHINSAREMSSMTSKQFQEQVQKAQTHACRSTHIAGIKARLVYLGTWPYSKGQEAMWTKTSFTFDSCSRKPSKPVYQAEFMMWNARKTYIVIPVGTVCKSFQIQTFHIQPDNIAEALCISLRSQCA